MILYFSATGNTEFVALSLADILGDEALDLLNRIREHDFSEINSDKPFVICAPTYVCEMPRFLSDYLRKTPLTGSREAYFVFTSGGYAGISGILGGRIVRKKGLNFKGYAELTMPRNYIATNAYPELSKDKIEARIRDTVKRLGQIADTILNGGILKARHVWLFETVITLPFNPVWCRLAQKTGGFYATDKCISCGICARRCPLNLIYLENGNPVWNRKVCSHCMSCIQNCPAEAIEYGSVTPGKKRYLFKKYRYAAGNREGSDG